MLLCLHAATTTGTSDKQRWPSSECPRLSHQHPARRAALQKHDLDKRPGHLWPPISLVRSLRVTVADSFTQTFQLRFELWPRVCASAANLAHRSSASGLNSMGPELRMTWHLTIGTHGTADACPILRINSAQFYPAAESTPPPQQVMDAACLEAVQHLSG